MTSDLQALLAAIVADPADDVARLVYADCLEENGRAARAAFIRVQIEAARHHPNSNARANLEAEAHALFAEHWVEWWGEVCAAVGFPAPAPNPGGRLGRFAARVGLRRAGGEPYFLPRDGHDARLLLCASTSPQPESLRGFGSVRFRRGFPDGPELHYGASDFLPAWVGVSPINSLTLNGAYPEWFHDGPHLAGVRALALGEYDSTVLPLVLNSPHLGALTDLRLEGWALYPDERTSLQAGELERVVSAPRARQLTRLTVPAVDEPAAEALAGAANLAGLEALEVQVLHDESEDRESAGRRLAALARSRHLAGLKALTLTGGSDAPGLSAVLRNPTWTGLRKLDIELWYSYDSLDPLAEADGLPLLEDVALGGIRLTAAEADALVRSPLLKRLRHFSLRCGPEDRSVLARLAGAVDVARIETFALTLPPLFPPGPDGTAALRKHFGGKLRVVTR